MRISMKITISVISAFIIVFGVYGLLYKDSSNTSILIMIVGILVWRYGNKRINQRFPKQ
jgi:membrane-bound ClpP family serine protease